MQDPSAHVPQFVLPHVHLISSYKFPVTATLAPEQALEYLLRGPQVVKDVAPVAWTYFQIPPGDGTIFLTWQPPQRQTRFPSDGYVWADPEATYTYEARGYTLEILFHRSGYRYNFEAVAVHSRTRYRIISKNPALPGPPFDPQLWIVHYGQAAPENRLPADRIQLIPEVQRIIQERQYMEKQGQLLRKEFMLHDRLNWPKVEFSAAGHMQQMHGQVRPGMYPGTPMQQLANMPRQQQFYNPMQGQNIGPSPAKRQRQAPPPQLPGAGAPGMAPGQVQMDSTIEDEENTALGDILDHLTPQEISKMRYKQHHEWMEEIFSSLYSTAQIQPIDLGLGLMGELAPLTKDILDAPDAESVKNLPIYFLPFEPQKNEPQRNFQPGAGPKEYKKLEPSQMVEFEKRVDTYIEKGQAELQKMKAEHAKRMADLRRSKTYMQADKRLKEAIWNSADGFHPVDRPLEDGRRGSAGPAPRENAQNIVEEVERSLGIAVVSRQNVVCVDKGGYTEEQPVVAPPPPPANESGNNDAVMESFTDSGALNGLLDEAAMDGGDNTAASLLDQYGTNSMATTPAANLSATNISQAASQVPTPDAKLTEAAPSTTTAGQDSVPASSELQQNQSLLEGMDLDVDMGGMHEAITDDKVAENDWVMVDNAEQTQGQAEISSTAAETAPPATASAASASASALSNAQEELSSASTAPPRALQPSTASPRAIPIPAPDEALGGSMFDAADFGSFDNLDSAGDALADYTANDDLDLGLGGALEDSAFGDAFHGTETHRHGDGGEGQP